MTMLIQVAVYSLVLWLGCYLINRDLSSWRLRFGGLALITYALNIGMTNILSDGIRLLLLVIPPLFWIGTLWTSIPKDAHIRQATPRYFYYLLGLATVFFTSGYLLMMFPAIHQFSDMILLLIISCDLLMLGVVVAVWDAFDAGEALIPDMLRSFTLSLLTIIVIAGQVLLIMPEVLQTTPVLIFMLVTTSILIITFDMPIQNMLDSLIFSRFPNIRQQRQQLRDAEMIVTRRAENPILEDEAEFIRYTRRALSHYGDLTKLATSPLTHLPIIQTRLTQRHAHDDTLERAKELKAVLLECIMRLKPNGADFGTSDEWRYFNAVYFPYVMGLKPYSLRVALDDLNGVCREAIDWFRSQVPERTLYNWQNAAAMLIAQDLRERTN